MVIGQDKAALVALIKHMPEDMWLTKEDLWRDIGQNVRVGPDPIRRKTFGVLIGFLGSIEALAVNLPTKGTERSYKRGHVDKFNMEYYSQCCKMKSQRHGAKRKAIGDAFVAKYGNNSEAIIAEILNHVMSLKKPYKEVSIVTGVRQFYPVGTSNEIIRTFSNLTALGRISLNPNGTRSRIVHISAKDIYLPVTVVEKSINAFDLNKVLKALEDATVIIKTEIEKQHSVVSN